MPGPRLHRGVTCEAQTPLCPGWLTLERRGRTRVHTCLCLWEGNLEETGEACSGEISMAAGRAGEGQGSLGPMGKAWPVSPEGEGARVLERAQWHLSWWGEGRETPPPTAVVAQGQVQQLAYVLEA